MSSGIVKVYGGPAEAPTHPGLGTRYYAARYKSGQGKPCLEMDPEEAKGEEVRRAKLYVAEHHGTRLMDAVRIVRADDPILAQQARPLPHERRKDESQAAGAARHCDLRARHFIKTGQAKTLVAAHKLACAEAPKLAARAGADPSLMPTKGRGR